MTERVCRKCGDTLKEFHRSWGNICRDCRNKQERERCQKPQIKAKISRYNKKYRKEHKDEIHARNMRNYYTDLDKTRKKKRQKGREFRRKVRHQIIELLGGKCQRCGFSDWRALQIDHINSNGKVDYKRFKSFNTTYLKHVTETVKNGDTSTYQLLCSNCNWIKKYEQNENPHVVTATG